MTASTRSEKLDLRLTASAKRVLQSAAAAQQCSVSEFVLESALARAAETLPDRQRFGLDAQAWGAFLNLITHDHPPFSTIGMERVGCGLRRRRDWGSWLRDWCDD